MTERVEPVLMCNSCGRGLQRSNGIYREDFVEIRKKWGYFSSKDTENHTLIFCESCYDRLIKRLVLPPQITEETEILGAD